ncbi:hypothetical protein [Dokdonella sp.]|uniref:hypothetical protein n=1 Tax=Dokdonella sp. TaxID=2291710 RepID=UPI001B216A94|nr:hypothetical protein [Dokdonella sp.]MBO9663327.1 hypothetical protein [Dokdonella sp.]
MLRAVCCVAFAIFPLERRAWKPPRFRRNVPRRSAFAASNPESTIKTIAAIRPSFCSQRGLWERCGRPVSTTGALRLALIVTAFAAGSACVARVIDSESSNVI